MELLQSLEWDAVEGIADCVLASPGGGAGGHAGGRHYTQRPILASGCSNYIQVVIQSFIV